MQAPFTTPVKADASLVCPPAPRRTVRLTYNIASIPQATFTNKFFVVNAENVILSEVTHVGNNNGNMMWKRTDNAHIIEASPAPAQVSIANADERIISWGQL
jgi:hypothetical protein